MFHDERDTPLSRQFIDIPLRQKTAMLNFLTRPMATRHVHVAGGTDAHYRVVPQSPVMVGRVAAVVHAADSHGSGRS